MTQQKLDVATAKTIAALKAFHASLGVFLSEIESTPKMEEKTEIAKETKTKTQSAKESTKKTTKEKTTKKEAVEGKIFTHDDLYALAKKKNKELGGGKVMNLVVNEFKVTGVSQIPTERIAEFVEALERLQ